MQCYSVYFVKELQALLCVILCTQLLCSFVRVKIAFLYFSV